MSSAVMGTFFSVVLSVLALAVLICDARHSDLTAGRGNHLNQSQETDPHSKSAVSCPPGCVKSVAASPEERCFCPSQRRKRSEGTAAVWRKNLHHAHEEHQRRSLHGAHEEHQRRNLHGAHEEHRRRSAAYIPPLSRNGRSGVQRGDVLRNRRLLRVKDIKKHKIRRYW